MEEKQTHAKDLYEDQASERHQLQEPEENLSVGKYLPTSTNS